MVGWVWPDDPIDHLIPSRAKLRILRTFSNQALVAITGANRLNELRTIASRDDLTGALNRRAFSERLNQELMLTRGSNEQITLVLYDLDQFKTLNDTHGHPAGDDALRGFTRILTQNLRTSDAVGRLGGDEFAIFLVGSDHTSTKQVVERVAGMLANDPTARSLLGASYGTAQSPADGTTSDELISVADARLYEQKRFHQNTKSDE
jgi:diguanylate cyclase (GGDEF)-like protein